MKYLKCSKYLPVAIVSVGVLAAQCTGLYYLHQANKEWHSFEPCQIVSTEVFGSLGVTSVDMHGEILQYKQHARNKLELIENALGYIEEKTYWCSTLGADDSEVSKIVEAKSVYEDSTCVALGSMLAGAILIPFLFMQDKDESERREDTARNTTQENYGSGHSAGHAARINSGHSRREEAARQAAMTQNNNFQLGMMTGMLAPQLAVPMMVGSAVSGGGVGQALGGGLATGMLMSSIV